MNPQPEPGQHHYVAKRSTFQVELADEQDQQAELNHDAREADGVPAEKGISRWQRQRLNARLGPLLSRGLDQDTDRRHLASRVGIESTNSNHPWQGELCADPSRAGEDAPLRASRIGGGEAALEQFPWQGLYP